MSTTGIDEAKLEAFMGQAVTDMGAIISAPLMLIGEKLGLYKAMAGAGPLTSQEVAERAGAAERYVREWLGNQAAGGYVIYDPESDRYTLPDEHALALADEDSPFYILGVYDLIASLYADEDQTCWRRSAAATAWAGTSTTTGCSAGPSASSAPAIAANLVAEWIPALDGVQAKLERGAKVADVGCGHGASTILMAEAFPNSRVLRLRLPRRVDRARPRGGRAGRRGRSHHLRRRDGQGLSRDRLRPGLRVRLPARHGRSRRGLGTHSPDARRRRHVDDRRAVRRRYRARRTSTRSGASSTAPRR